MASDSLRPVSLAELVATLSLVADLGSDHSLARDPDVTRLRAAAAALGEDLWVTVRLPGGYEGDNELPDAGAAVSRWTSVVLHPDELGWLREALALNAAGGEDDENDIQPW